MTYRRTELSLRRAVVAFCVLAIAFNYYRNLPIAGWTIGFSVGVAAFFIVLLARRDELLGIARCYVYAAVCALLTAGPSPLEFSPTLWGGVIGWALAVVHNEFIRARKRGSARLVEDVDAYGQG